ncbi:MAG TPA: hypothetical protein VF755_13050, partial [Catenuloplanes sp.]
MARPGPAPQNRRHGHGGVEWTDVPDTPYAGPGSDLELPTVPGVTWFPQVLVWWEQLRTMPHCVLWSATDWLFAIETAYMKQDFWGEYFGGEVHATKATEMRRREDQMGLTREARRKLAIRYVDPNLLARPTEPPNSDDEITAHGTAAADTGGAGG